MTTARVVFSAAAIALAMTSGQPAMAAGPHGASAPVLDRAQLVATKAQLRDLWIGHVFWVRNVVVAGLAADNAAQAVAEKQAVANAKAIAASIEPFYGAKAKEKMFALLAGHYGAIKSYLNASIAKNMSAQADATAVLVANAGEIARFLGAANPFLPANAVDGLLQVHGGHHIAQIQHLQARKHAEEAQTWADMTQHMYVISDAIADALAKQFPAKS